MNKNKRLQFTQKHKHKKEEARKIQTTNNKQEERTGTTKLDGPNAPPNYYCYYLKDETRCSIRASRTSSSRALGATQGEDGQAICMIWPCYLLTYANLGPGSPPMRRNPSGTTQAGPNGVCFRAVSLKNKSVVGVLFFFPTHVPVFSRRYASRFTPLDRRARGAVRDRD
jgi:hypothetical protein